MAKDYAKGFYHSKAWRDTQAAYMASQHYVCERCGGVARIVHHKTYITPQNINDPSITLAWTNLEALCMDCHAREHQRTHAPRNGIAFDENGNVIKAPNVFLVCGSPGSGKSTYVRENKKANDLVIDLDYICAALMGEPDNIYLNHEPVLSVALEIRGLLYKIVASRKGIWERAFVITSVSNPMEQKAIAMELNAEIVVIDTPLEDCIRRINNDERRANSVAFFEKLAKRWWNEYEHPPLGK